ncbi:MAG TPA: hypothetical protein P5526_22735 [Anaerolineae bacterium]|nr:hypothetical protein [Anaerolineae bacterium]
MSENNSEQSQPPQRLKEQVPDPEVIAPPSAHESVIGVRIKTSWVFDSSMPTDDHRPSRWRAESSTQITRFTAWDKPSCCRNLNRPEPRHSARDNPTRL